MDTKQDIVVYKICRICDDTQNINLPKIYSELFATHLVVRETP